MFKLFQKHAPVISISLLIILLMTLIFQQGLAQTLSTIILVFGIGTAILFTIHGNWLTKQNDELTNAQFARNTVVDLLGLALVMGAAVWFGRLTGFYAGLAWGNTSTWLSASFAGIIVAMAVGFIVAFLVGKTWSKVAEPMKIATA